MFNYSQTCLSRHLYQETTWSKRPISATPHLINSSLNYLYPAAISLEQPGIFLMWMVVEHCLSLFINISNLYDKPVSYIQNLWIQKWPRETLHAELQLKINYNPTLLCVPWLHRKHFNELQKWYKACLLTNVTIQWYQIVKLEARTDLCVFIWMCSFLHFVSHHSCNHAHEHISIPLSISITFERLITYLLMRKKRLFR